jgi:3-hydroxyisobutyrate dehydrogenase and related beta-hydroxyacid dehydrogenases
MADPTVGFVGLGIMGLPMANNLLEAGYPVVGYNRSREPVDDLVEHGGEGAETAAEAARRSDVVVTCLPDSNVVETVVRENGGIMDGFDGGETLIDCSTISPTVTEELASDLAAMGVDMLDAPISGGEEGAIEGTLSIMVGGDAAVLDAYRGVFEATGGTITHCGPSGAGQVAKACNQIVVANTMEAVSEALVLAGKAGADVEAVVDAISGGAAGCWTLDNRAPSMIRGDFEPGFFASYQYKDLRIATSAGEEFGAPMPITAVTHDMYKTMEETGMGEDDNSGVMQVLEMMAGEEIRIDEE